MNRTVWVLSNAMRRRKRENDKKTLRHSLGRPGIHQRLHQKNIQGSATADLVDASTLPPQPTPTKLYWMLGMRESVVKTTVQVAAMHKNASPLPKSHQNDGTAERNKAELMYQMLHVHRKKLGCEIKLHSLISLSQIIRLSFPLRRRHSPRTKAGLETPRCGDGRNTAGGAFLQPSWGSGCE